MGALKLECFTCEATESKLGPPLPKSFDTARTQAFAEGVKTGADAASKAFEAEKLRLLSPILESLRDLEFTQVEARKSVLQSLRPLIEAMITTVLPHAASLGFAAEVAALVQKATDQAASGQIVVTVPADAVEPIWSMLSTTGAELQVNGDPDFPDLAATVFWGNGVDKIDLNTTQQSILDSIDEFYLTTEISLKSGVSHD